MTAHPHDGHAADMGLTDTTSKGFKNDRHSSKGCTAVCCAILAAPAVQVAVPQIQIAIATPALEVDWSGTISRIYKPPKVV